MHIDYTLHFWTAVGFLSSFATAATFLWQVYKQIRKGVDAVRVMVAEHHELYDWYSTHVKPKSAKPNGAAHAAV